LATLQILVWAREYEKKKVQRGHGSPDNVAGVPASESIESAKAETLAVVSQEIGR
jgi:hypothetical protein